MDELVSIIIPVYNGADYVKKAIDSALAQTYRNVEILVINDGSTDNTEEIVLSYGDKIRYFKKENGGVSSALNYGIREMKGKYFSWLSHDDEYAPDKVQDQMTALTEFGDDRLLCLCHDRSIDKNSHFFKKKAKKRFKEEKIYSWQEALKSMLKYGSFGGCNFLIPRTVFDDVGLFDETLRYAQDALMWAKIFIKGYRLLYVDRCGVFTRIHDKQLTQTGRNVFKHDSVVCCELLLPFYLTLSTRQYNFVYYCGYREAKYCIKEVVDRVITEGKKHRKLTPFDILLLRLEYLYGCIRPYIKKIYYRFVMKVKTN